MSQWEVECVRVRRGAMGGQLGSGVFCAVNCDVTPLLLVGANQCNSVQLDTNRVSVQNTEGHCWTYSAVLLLPTLFISIQLRFLYLQAGGQGFESPHVHQKPKKNETFLCSQPTASLGFTLVLPQRGD
jgi:hypothetical protein